MGYELAKQLKDAGFPQNIYLGSDYYSEKKKLLRYARRDVAGGTNSLDVKVPTLSELIEAFGDETWFTLHFYPTREGNDKWQADSGIYQGHYNWFGSTPKEAAAKLWLAIHHAK